MRAPLVSVPTLLFSLLCAPSIGRAAPPTTAEEPRRIERVALLSEGLDHPALLDALTLRLPTTRVLGAAEACTDGCVTVRVRTLGAPPRSVIVEAILGDGRVFIRTMPAASAEVERGVATLLAHLLTSIVTGDPPLIQDEVGALQPEVPAPPRHAEAKPEAKPEAQPPPHPEAADESRRATPEERAPGEIERRPPPRFELGPALGLTTVMGVGAPREFAGRVGGGSLLDLELRSPKGLLVSASGRVLDARESGYRLTRLRFALALGYGLRRGLFELRTLAAVSVEPWWVRGRADGARATFGQPLLGGSLILAPGVHAALSGDVRVHAGLRAAASATAPPAGAGTILATDGAGAELFRLGGFELSLLAEIGVRWGLRRRVEGAGASTSR